MTDTSELSLVEVAPRVWVAHHEWMHVNITLVGGSDGLVMVDTHGSARAAREVADAVRRLGAGPVTALVNTHDHWDHWFGNDVLRRRSSATCRSTRRVRRSSRWSRAGDRPDPDAVGDDPRAEEILDTTLRPADPRLLLGGRPRPRRPGRRADPPRPRPHRRGPGRAGARRRRDGRRRPGRGVGQAVHRRRLLPAGVAAHPRPGARAHDRRHRGRPRATGSSSTRTTSRSSAPSSAIIAETIRDLASRGVPVGQALDAGEWPWDRAAAHLRRPARLRAPAPQPEAAAAHLSPVGGFTRAPAVA